MHLFKKLSKENIEVITKTSRQTIALCLLVTFLTQTALASSVIQTNTESAPTRVNAADPKSFFSTLSIPAEAGYLESLAISRTLNNNSTPVLLIQDAHANPEAQKNIAAVLSALAKNNQLAGVAVEGAFGPVDAHLLDIFDDEKTNREFSDQLVSQGQLTGAEIFSRDAQSSQVPVQGADDRELYLKSFKAYQQVKQDSVSQTVLENYRTILTRMEVTLLNPELASFLRERRKWLEKGNEAADYVRLVARLAKTAIGVDLADPVSQFKRPALMRLVRSMELEDSMNPERVQADVVQLKKDWAGKTHAALFENGAEALTAAIRDRGFSDWLHHQDVLSVHTARRFFEELTAASAQDGLSLLNYPDLLSFAAILILHEEIVTKNLMEELTPLEEKIESRLIQNPKEREFIGFSKDLDLVEKLLQLKLTRADYQVLTQRETDFSAAVLRERLLKISAGKETSLSPDDLIAQATLDLAREFYQLSLFRDAVLVKKTAELAAANQNNSDFLKVTVLIAGGFHQEGVLRELDQRGIAHAVLTPQIKNMPDEPLYEKVMSGQGSMLTQALSIPAATLMAEILGGSDYLTDAAAPGRREGVMLEGLLGWRVQQLIALGQSPEFIYEALSRGLQRANEKGLIGRTTLILKDEVQPGGVAELQLTLADHGLVLHYEMTPEGARQTRVEHLKATGEEVKAQVVSPPAVGPTPATRSLRRSEVRRHPIIVTSDLTAAQEHLLLSDLYEKLKREQRNPQSEKFVKVVPISDQHGTIDKFDELILDAIRSVLKPGTIPDNFTLNHDQPLAEQLAPLGITLEELREKIFFHNGGDLMDRGPYGVKVFRRSRELIRAGLSSFVVGNHDIWEALNLWGTHLPWYDGFNFYGYSDSYDQENPSLRVEKMVAQYHRTKPETLTKLWWARKLKEFTDFHQKRQKDVWNALDVQLNGAWDKSGKKRVAGTGMYAEVSASLTPEQDRLWGQFRGYNPVLKIDVYTGVRAAGLVSIVWWEDLLKKFKGEFEKIQLQDDYIANLPSNRAWRDAISMIEHNILPELRIELSDHLNKKDSGNPDGQWWWRVFEAINSQNYTSVEWWAKDWVYHKDWGTSVLDELSAEDPSHHWDAGNYLENRDLQEIAEFYRDHFNLQVEDIYQNKGTHAFLPVDPKTGEFYFTYRGQEYRGNGSSEKPSVWDGLKHVSADIKNRSNTLSDLYDALSLVNSWYADATTEAKAPTIAKIVNKFGAEHLANVNGIRGFLWTGHVPFYEYHKLGSDKLGVISGANWGNRFITVDHGMGERFGSRGAYLSVHPGEGVYFRGYEHDGASAIVDHPRTVKTTQGTEGLVEEVLFENPGIPSEMFLPQLIQNVKARLEELRLQIIAADPHVVSSIPIGRGPIVQALSRAQAIVETWRDDQVGVEVRHSLESNIDEAHFNFTQNPNIADPRGMIEKLIVQLRAVGELGEPVAQILDAVLPARSEVRLGAAPSLDQYLAKQSRNVEVVLATAVSAASGTVDVDLSQRFPEVRARLLGEGAVSGDETKPTAATAEMQSRMDALLKSQKTVERPKTVVVVSVNGQVPQIDPSQMDLLPGSRVVILDRRGSEDVGRRQFSKIKLAPDIKREHFWFQGEYPTLDELKVIFEGPSSARPSAKAEPGQAALPLLVLPYVEESFLNSQYAALKAEDGIVVRTPKMRGEKLRENFSRFLGLRAAPSELRDLLPDEFKVRVREHGFSSAFIPLEAEGRFASLMDSLLQTRTVETAA